MIAPKHHCSNYPYYYHTV